MGFENVAFSDKATCSHRKVLLTCLTSYVNKSGHAPITLDSNGVLSLLRISKLDADHYATCILPRKEFDTGNE